MAERLIASGFQVRGFDVDRTKVTKLANAAGIGCDNIREVCEEADAVVTMLPRDEHVRGALIGPGGVKEHLRQGALVIDMSTISPRGSLAVAGELKAAGLRVLDAPVGRTPADAQAGTLLVMAGGDREDFDEATAIFRAVADKVIYMGPSGSGIRMKVVNNYMTMVTLVVTAETLTMAKKAGIASAAAVEVLQNTTAGRGQINVNFPKKVLAGDISPDFPLLLGDKDLSLALGLGRDVGAPLFLGAAARELFGLAPAMGRGEQDCTAMLLILEALAGIENASMSPTQNATA